MLYEINRTDVWVGEVEDCPGALAEKLETLSKAGANLEFMVVRRDSENPGTAVMFVSPLRGAAAAEAGLTKSTSMCTVRLEGPHMPGLGAKVARAIADQGLNMRGVSGAAIGDRDLFNIAFANPDEAEQATLTLNRVLAGRSQEPGPDDASNK